MSRPTRDDSRVTRWRVERSPSCLSRRVVVDGLDEGDEALDGDGDGDDGDDHQASSRSTMQVNHLTCHLEHVQITYFLSRSMIPML